MGDHPIPDAALDEDIAILGRKGVKALAAYLHRQHGTASIHIDHRTIAEPEVIDRIFGDRITVTPGGCWRRAGSLGNALGHKKLSIHDRRVWQHRVAYALVNGEIPSDKVVCHRCDVPDCVNPVHLFVGSQLDNVHDAKRKGRMVSPPIASGEGHHSATLSNSQVADLVSEASAPGASQRAVARRFGVSQSTVWRLVHGVVRPQGAASQSETVA